MPQSRIFSRSPWHRFTHRIIQHIFANVNTLEVNFFINRRKNQSFFLFCGKRPIIPEPKIRKANSRFSIFPAMIPDSFAPISTPSAPQRQIAKSTSSDTRRRRRIKGTDAPAEKRKNRRFSPCASSWGASFTRRRYIIKSPPLPTPIPLSMAKRKAAKISIYHLMSIKIPEIMSKTEKMRFSTLPFIFVSKNEPSAPPAREGMIRGRKSRRVNLPPMP